MSAIPRPVWIALLLVMAAVAVVRNVVFFTRHGTSGPSVVVDDASDGTILGPIVAAGQSEAVVDRTPLPARPPEQRLAGLRTPPVFAGDRTVIRDPFHLPPRPASPSVRKHPVSWPAPVGPEVRIVLISGQRQVAMVDSQIVAPGDVIGGRRVAEITADGLRLTGRDGETRIELSPLQTDLANDELP
jgi:hypothetical protein